jgi:hypothetical protein
MLGPVFGSPGTASTFSGHVPDYTAFHPRRGWSLYETAWEYVQDLWMGKWTFSVCERVSCGGGIQYFHRSPTSRRRRRKGQSRIWDSKIWLRISRDSDPRMTTLARASSKCKRQPLPLVRESAPYLTVIKFCGKPWIGALFQDRLADWASVVTWDSDSDP